MAGDKTVRTMAFHRRTTTTQDGIKGGTLEFANEERNSTNHPSMFTTEDSPKTIDSIRTAEPEQEEGIAKVESLEKIKSSNLGSICNNQNHL